MLQKKRIQKSFSRCAAKYERKALLQKETAEQLIAGLSPISPTAPPVKVLEVGVGTGYLAQLLRRQMPSHRIIACDLALGMLTVAKQKELPGLYLSAADAEYLPYINNTFDLIISSLTYQWVSNLEQAFRDAFRVLKKGGVLRFASLGPTSLHELRESYALAHQQVKGVWPDYLQEFSAISDVENALYKAGFKEITLSSKSHRKVYASPVALLRTLQDIGAGNASAARPRGLASREVFREMERIYRQNHSAAHGVWGTYEIIWAQAGRT